MDEQRAKDEREKLEFLKENEAKKMTLLKGLLSTLQQLVDKH